VLVCRLYSGVAGPRVEQRVQVSYNSCPLSFASFSGLCNANSVQFSSVPNSLAC